jgi:hypothetical protein
MTHRRAMVALPITPHLTSFVIHHLQGAAVGGGFCGGF